MSERQARLKRKNQEEELTVKKTKKSDIVTNFIICIIILAVVVLGAWAIYSKYNSAANTDTTKTADDNAATQVQTVSDVAAEKDLSTDEFISAYGLENVEGISADMDFQAAMQSMTLENYAKYLDQDLDELISSIDIDAQITADMTVGELVELVSQAQTENSETATSEENE